VSRERVLACGGGGACSPLRAAAAPSPSAPAVLAGQNKMQAPPPNARKLDEETTDFKHQRVTQEFKVALQQARTGKKLTQAELAQRINVKASVINDYESGRAIPDPSVISKLNRVLGVVLPKIPKKKKEAGGGDEEEAAQ
jgi:ribosome-binding protein aMBF1 (putative translation factor)